MSSLPYRAETWVPRLAALQRRLRDHVLDHLRQQGEALAAVASHGVDDGDTQYRIDVHADKILWSAFAEWGRETPFILVSEGLPGAGWRVFPEHTPASDAAFFLIVDPIDGSREIMYDKRSAWSLAAVAPNNGPDTTLADVEAAVQTEIPTTRHLYGDTLWAVRGQGARAERQNLLTGETVAFTPRPSRALSVAHGFASLTKFFPGGKVTAAQFEDNLFEGVFGAVDTACPLAFDDQYISTGGQLYELMVGHDRFNGDLRPFLAGRYPPGLCCHPYDICTELIAREAGVLVTDERGGPLRTPLDIRAPVAWLGYANPAIHAELAPTVERLMFPYIPLPAAAPPS